ncbi:hypothetical protein ABKW28_20270 [Nocardioides sp. 31GB23]|uniref:DUF2530 domain-containing protein n=1 Tax=Nocardioides salarius TaxID=374513 RepID=A0ABS2MDG8_9ACTN|nr:hypothetical protein [Nocardioides salarius]MBM7509233.1 hypothetical protein [Nocardioides salarius]
MSEHENETTEQTMPTMVEPPMEPAEQGFWAEGRHPVNVGQLVMGLAFLGLAAIWAVLAADALDGDALRWLLPVPWLVAGAAGLLATTLGAARRRGAGR